MLSLKGMRRLHFLASMSIGGAAGACLLAPLGCESSRVRSDSAPKATAPATVTAPVASTLASSSVGLPALWDAGAPCPRNLRRYRITVEGDGGRLLLGAGAPAADEPWIACEPSALRLSGRWSVSACGAGAEAAGRPSLACFWADSAEGAYLDRSGSMWRLTISGFPSVAPDGRVKGRFQAIAEKQGGTPGSPLTLSVDVDVGADVAVIAMDRR